jgi:acyl-CoA synthetase (AMP-forming)/AMP-acid ligase II/3-hydroxymyristoyl/3-hydroxydecanoyl-(acyl carrier protein) dehydratase
MLPLAKYRAPGDPVLLGPGGEITATVFFRQAKELADALPARGFVVNLCETRHGFMLGFAAALLRRQTSLLPPGQGRRDWELLLRQYPDAYLLSESASLQSSAGGDPVFEVGPYMSRALDAATRGSTALRCPQIDCAHKAAILFTSGSTGQPTAHDRTWGQLCRGAAALATALDWAEIPGYAVVGSVPPQHMFGLEATVMLPWFTGVPVHAQKPLLPADLEVALRQTARPSWWMTTPLHLRAPLRGSTSLTGLAGVVASTMGLPAPLARAAEAAWHVPVLEIYGSTETGALAARRTAMETLWTTLHGVSLRYEGDCASAGSEGRQVWASGAHFESPVMLGDEVDIQPDGRFLWIGRSSDLIKVGGKRTSLSALNQDLTDIPGVDDGACFFPEEVTSNASDDTHPTRRLAALYVSSTLSPQDVLNALRTRIDPVFLPRPIFRVAQLPRNANGKLTAAALADLYARRKTQELPGPRLPAPEGIQSCAVPVAHPSIPGHFPGDPIVPGVVILARVAEAIRSRFPDIELGALLNVRFHAPLRPGESFCVRPQLQAGLVRFEVQLADPAMGSQSNSGAVIVSGRWAFNAPVCSKPYRK